MPWHADLIPWYVFAAYWLITALRVKRAKAAEKLSDRVASLIVLIAGFALLLSDWPAGGWLRQRWLPIDSRIEWAGVAITTVGVAIAIWARYCIGEYWSARVTLKEGHRLIRAGPYGFVRHPIYTGILMGAVGSALTQGERREIVAVALVLAAYWRKALREESMLTQEFGDEYAEYRKGTGFLLPRIWSRRVEQGEGRGEE